MTLHPPTASVPNFATPDEAEQGFYESIAQANLDALMAVWADEDEIVCVDPDGRRAAGHGAIRQGWQSIFSGCHHLEIELTNIMRWQSGLIAIHLVQESITMFSVPEELTEPEHPNTLVRRNGVTTTTNVYVRGANGWRMVCHQATAQLASIEEHVANTATHTLH
ncbi:MAG: YybH family protein [Fluviibacter sp.]